MKENETYLLQQCISTTSNGPSKRKVNFKMITTLLIGHSYLLQTLKAKARAGQIEQRATGWNTIDKTRSRHLAGTGEN